MRTLLVLNPKGGSGKSTVAMNIAGYYAQSGAKVAIVDGDPQASCADWLALRPASAPPILQGRLHANKITLPGRTEIAVIDTPAAIHGARLANFVRTSETMVIPVSPSPIDIRAAEHFLEELYSLRRLINRKVRLATVANRAREDTLAAVKLESYLDRMKLPGGQRLPFITMLRNSQNYVKAAERGLSIFEFAPAKTVYDREQWKPLLRWLNSSRSIPG